MSIFRFSNAGGFGTYQRYNDFLAGNPTTPVITDLGAMFPLGEFTLASAQSTVDFTNIPQTYTHLQLRGIVRSTVAGTGSDSVLVRFNADAANNYSLHRLWGTGSSPANADGYANQAQTAIPVQARDGNTASSYGVFVYDLLDYRNTNKNKTVRILCGADFNGSGDVWLVSGAWYSGTAVTSIRLVAGNSGNFAVNSQFALYGVLA